jgi:exopolyphosphatase/guanosine-5'-triphosphate,3'-diphosphate pyrophosphatase
VDDENFESLPQQDRLIVIKLFTLLCLADAMDINSAGKVTDVNLKKTKKGWRMQISGESDLMLVNWALEKRKSLFREVFGVNLEID